ncbi:MAG: DEAD/DEAH box helicase family protein [Magnetococcales bacterium]|nr:DEAD/DEAH box helicase family protein [Magnetococcales bacterium]
MIQITFNLGTLLINATPTEMASVAAYVRPDERVGGYRAQARHYGPIVMTLHRQRLPYQDQARGFSRQAFRIHDAQTPRPHQQASLEAWLAADKRGVVVLPTGAGKTLVARLAITAVQRDTLILVPTIDLMHQWYEQLKRTFATEIGLWGGGEHVTHPITVSTYDSALIHLEYAGNRFGFLICDECHHLPALSTRQVAIMSVAPFRLGLTATPERTDGQEADLYELLGPLCHRCEINELEGTYLAPYQLEQVPVILDPDERQAYDAAYAHYRRFAQESGIRLGTAEGWGRFIQVCARSREGRAAFAAYRLQKRLARASRAKLRMVWHLLRHHRGEQALLFTDDNATAYTIGETFFLPVITHKTRVSERKHFLDLFRAGQIDCLVTSRVLNEGVDVPNVAVGIVVSGTGSVREHVQRLGRILRPRAGKQAILYELVSADTAETFTSVRRRQHAAYQKDPATPPC